MATPNVAITGSFDPVSWRNLQRDLARLEPELRKELNNEIKTIGDGIVSEAKRAASWSTRIPGAISLSVTTSRIGVKVNRRRAPHARSYEGVRRAGFGSQSQFRHPVFGQQAVWVSQPTRPFLAPAIRANQDAFFRSAEESIVNAARAVGWS